MSAPYGDVLITCHDDGRLTVERADDVIGVSVELLASLGHGVVVDPAGNLVLAGQCAYRPIGFASTTGLCVDIVVCQRVWGP